MLGMHQRSIGKEHNSFWSKHWKLNKYKNHFLEMVLRMFQKINLRNIVSYILILTIIWIGKKLFHCLISWNIYARPSLQNLNSSPSSKTKVNRITSFLWCSRLNTIQNICSTGMHLSFIISRLNNLTFFLHFRQIFNLLKLIWN